MTIGKIAMILCLVPVMGLSCVGLGKKVIAKKLAEDYIQKKYTRKMKYVSVNSTGPFIDLSYYSVFFSPLDEPEIIFEVIIPWDLTEPTERTNKYGYFVPDNYLLRLFSFDAKKMLDEKIQNIWGSVKTSVYVPVKDSRGYSFQVPIEINEQMEPKDMEPYLKYDFFINVDLLFSGLLIEKEAVSILDAFLIIKKAGYKPNEIIFWYKTDSNEKKMVEFENWFEISTVSPIIESMTKLMDSYP
jgi:hypothetical protein